MPFPALAMAPGRGDAGIHDAITGKLDFLITKIQSRALTLAHRQTFPSDEGSAHTEIAHVHAHRPGGPVPAFDSVFALAVPRL